MTNDKSITIQQNENEYQHNWMENEYGRKCSKYVGKWDPISQRIAVKINSHLLYYEQIVEHINLMIDSNVSIVNEKRSYFFVEIKGA